jgi:ankyrin repeat protein
MRRIALGGWLVPMLAAVSLGAAGESPLVRAMKDGDMDAVRRIVRARAAEVNVALIDGTTPLHWAVHLDNVPATDLLIKAGAKVQAANRYGATPLWLAAVNGNAEIVDKLLAGGADPNTTMAAGDTVLMTAARTGNLAVVRALLRSGAEVNAKETWKGQTALMWAAASNNAAVVEALVEAGADVQARTKYKPPFVTRGGGLRAAERSADVTRQAGFTALMFAVRAGAIESVKVLLSSGATVDDRLSDGTSALVVAVASTHYELADYLLDRGADPNAQANGWTPLHQLVWTRRPGTGFINPGLVSRDKVDSLALAKKLLAKGADPLARMTKDPDITYVGRRRLTYVGATPFWLAAETVDLPYMRLLAASGGAAMLPNRSGDTPLLAASGLGIEKPGESPGRPEEVDQAVALCLELGADATTVDAQGNTALHGVAVWGANGAVEALVAAGAKLDVKNKKGQTPWRIAEGAVFEDAVLAQPETAALLRRLMEERGLTVE